MIWFWLEIVLIVGAGLHIFFDRRARNRQRILEICLLWLLVGGVGMGSLLGFYAHTFMANQTARQIGWPVGNPFQFEVAMANLAFGILGILCSLLRKNFWLATSLGFAIFWLGCAYGHIYQLVVHKNYAPDNAGYILYNDIFFPIILLILLMSYMQASRHTVGEAEMTWQ